MQGNTQYDVPKSKDPVVMVNIKNEYLGLCETADDNNCVAHCLGTSRTELVDLLEKYIDLETVRKLLLPELMEATLGLRFPQAIHMHQRWVSAEKDFTSAKANVTKHVDTLEKKASNKAIHVSHPNKL
jgi:hypothetical protein